MKRKPTERDSLARGMAQMGLMDSPSLRHFLRGEQVEIWRRNCSCAGDCDCWELDKPISATDAHREAFFLAQRPTPPKPTPALPQDDDAIRAAAEQAQDEARRRWRPIFQEDAR